MKTKTKIKITLGVIIVGLIFIAALKGIHSKDISPNVSVQGTVIDARTGEPIAGAKVSDGQYAGGKQFTFTDVNGKFQYQTWPEEHNILVEAKGYLTQKKVLNTGILQNRKEISLDFALETQ